MGAVQAVEAEEGRTPGVTIREHKNQADEQGLGFYQSFSWTGTV